MINQMGVNLFLYTAMFFTVYIGAYMEIFLKKRYFPMLILSIVLFSLTAISRIGHSYDYSDFIHYIDYFMSDNDAYFEPGYVLVTQLVKELFGYSPIYFVLTIIFLVLIGVCILIWDLNRQNTISYDKTRKSFFYIYIFLAIWCINSGVASCCEGIRPGLSITYMYISVVNTLNRKWFNSIFYLALSSTIHTQSLIFFPGIVFLYLIDTFSKRMLSIWLLLIVLVGLFIYYTGLLDFSILGFIINTLDNHGDASHYEGYLLATDGSFISTQWLTKHMAAFLLLFGNLKNKQYNRAVILYFMGLSIGAIMQSSTIFLRFEGIYTSSILFALYYFLRDTSFPKVRRFAVLSLYMTFYGIMLLRWLGWYV